MAKSYELPSMQSTSISNCGCFKKMENFVKNFVNLRVKASLTGVKQNKPSFTLLIFVVQKKKENISKHILNASTRPTNQFKGKIEDTKKKKEKLEFS